MRVLEPGDNGPQLGKHFVSVAFRGGKIVPQVDFRIVLPHHLVNGELRPVLENLEQAFDLDEIVAVEGVHDLGDVVPHLRVKIAGAVAEQEGKIRLSRFLLTDVLGLHQESRGHQLVRLEVPYVERLHSLLR